jgi:alpha-tubulin suppressor-like RCC1 family protein
MVGQCNIPQPARAGASAIAAGASHSLIVTSDGRVLSFGGGVPDAPPQLGPVARVAAGQGFSVALTRDGRAVAW